MEQTQGKQKKQTKKKPVSLFGESDEEDDDYVPTQQEIKKSEKYEKKPKKNQRRTRGFSPSSTLSALKDDFYSKTKEKAERKSKEEQMTFEETLEEAKRLVELFANEPTQKKNDILLFAGKQYKLNEKNELVEYHEEPKDQEDKRGREDLQEEDERDSFKKERECLLAKRKNMRRLIDYLSIRRKKSMSAVAKSRMDWQRFSRITGTEKEFEANRKDGFVKKEMFLNQVRENEKAGNSKGRRMTK